MKINILKGFYLLATLTVTLMSFSSTADNKSALSLKVYNSDKNSFHVNSTLVYGETEAVLIDTGFTRADALRIAANVLDSGKKLTTIFISQADPDFYFGIETLRQIFPDVNVITTPAVRKAISIKMGGKLAYWGPKMGVNAPKNVLLPDVYSPNSFTVDGYKIEVKGTEGVLANRPFVWIPSIKAIVGNIAVFGDLHVWTADTQSSESLAAWQHQLQEMKELSPKVVVPGHMKKGTQLNVQLIDYTATYLTDFIDAKRKSINAQALIDIMTTRYPDAELNLALAIGAKVHMGEMKW
ncbi:MBL fold metallo-hydrolase [Psychrosphaera sp. B3R10]|uniref:MBL fold metallo-hydrolase n=1 Tax=unclassified Psychrosphaera TaxID=2641570 RepID=UPI001C09B902|nr:MULTISPECIES: MBL fold metallo-hydrolase [unclassified Psychrosphaera]MBU2882351.1 MBL fold metallo-hydrolase [Psychrosphaera sp. I2R16]MBU2989032.1 MBL fold metallo-hydrolase [Psychrosphaera sp. B3R10]